MSLLVGPVPPCKDRVKSPKRCCANRLTRVFASGAMALALVIGLVGSSSGGRSASELVDAAPAPDWYAIQYSKVPGCGLYVQYFDKEGTEATDKSKRIAFFTGGAAPDITSEACVRYCAQWEELGIIDIVRRSYQHRLGLTHVTGTCYLRGERVGGPRTLWRDGQR